MDLDGNREDTSREESGNIKERHGNFWVQHGIGKKPLGTIRTNNRIIVTRK